MSEVTHFTTAKPDRSGNVTACGLEMRFPMRGNGWRATGVTCEECNRFLVDAGHAALKALASTKNTGSKA